MFVCIHLGHGEAVDVVATAREQAYDPREHSVVCALQNPPRVTYKLTPVGAFRMKNIDFEPIDAVPDEVTRYPHAAALIAAVGRATRARIDELEAARDAERRRPAPVPMGWMDDAPSAGALGSDGCDEHHVDGFYVGCY